MKKVFAILFLVFGTQLMDAHPGITGHSHESVISEWAWLLIPIVAISMLGIYLTKKRTKSI